MGLINALRLTAPPAPKGNPVDLSTGEPAAVAGADPSPSTFVDTSRAEAVALDIALSIGAVRKAMHVIAGTIGTWPLGMWADTRRLQVTDQRAGWLAEPQPGRTRQWIVTRTVQDLVWRDRAVWRVEDRHLNNIPSAVERIHPHRLDSITDPRDPDTVTTWIIDGHEITAPTSRLIVFDGAGLGGLSRFGAELLTIYGKLQTAAGRYAEAPHPHAILKNHGADLDDDEIETLLASWEAARGTRSVGYLNDVIDYDTFGWNAQELQLTEAREQAALDVARLFGLPAFAVDASTGDSMTYSNIVDRRRDMVDALDPWTTVIEDTLTRTVARRSATGARRPLQVRFETSDYTRPDAKDRSTTWAQLINAGIITAEEARTLDPLTRSL